MENRETTPIDPGRVTTTVEHGIATVSFHHPKGNSLPAALLARLARDIAAAGASADVRVIVLRSAGAGPFCAGASFDELVAVDSPDAGTAFFSGFAHVILAMIRSPKFIVTRVHGKAAGGAVGLIAASDYAIAASSAAAKLSELAIGIGPFVVGPVIEKKIGLAAYQAMAVDAAWRTAEWCERHGLYAAVCSDEVQLDERVAALAATLAAANPEAMAQLKRVFWAGTEPWETLLAERARMSGTLVLSPFTRDAIARFNRR